jgi:DNA-binding response OmpR family regulator
MTEPANFPVARPVVLVVEDEPHICELIADILDAEDFEPVCVHTDVEAFERLQSGGPFAGMIVDVNLGKGVTGYDVARYARGLTPSMPILFASGESAHGSFDTHGVPGALFVAKPFTVDGMIAKVRELIGDRSG